jgi:hypothetical protein
MSSEIEGNGRRFEELLPLAGFWGTTEEIMLEMLALDEE